MRVERVPDPSLLNPRDAIIKVTTSAICGSDLRLLDGFIPTMKPPQGYRTFRDQWDTCVKVVLKPHETVVH